MREPIATPRELARELARKYSTMTHEELDVLESVLVPMKFSKGEIILREGEVCRNIYYVERGLIRQFYFKNGKQITEHLGVDHTIFMCIESLYHTAFLTCTDEKNILLFPICHQKLLKTSFFSAPPSAPVDLDHLHHQ